MITITGKTNIGRRKANEDRIIADTDWHLALVADGMGGAGSGDVASQIVAATVVDRIAAGANLNEAITAAHEAVLAAAKSGRGNAGMGSTVVSCVFNDYDYEIAWIGDSRAYLWDGETLRQLTRDHSKVEMLLASADISQQEALQHPEKNVITRAMGIPWDQGDPVPTIKGTLAAGQVLLLCSDGLNDAAGDVKVREILSAGGDNTLQTLIDAALTAGGADNISVVLCRADENGPVVDPGSTPEAVAITGADGKWQHFTAPKPTGSTTNNSSEIETTKIQVIQPGSIASQGTATPKQGDATPPESSGKSKLSTTLVVTGLMIAVAACYLYFSHY